MWEYFLKDYNTWGGGCYVALYILVLASLYTYAGMFAERRYYEVDLLVSVVVCILK